MILFMTQISYSIKDILADYWDSFLSLALNLRPVILKEVHKVIHCANPTLGHALYFCSYCSSFKQVPFTCKSRFCNSCGYVYVKNRALKLSSKLINCNHRHLVFTIPKELHIFFRKDRSLIHLLFKASAQTLLSWFASQNKK